MTSATGIRSAKRANEVGVERVERPAGEPFGLRPEHSEVLDDDGSAFAVAQHVDASTPVVEVQPEVVEDAVDETDAKRAPAPAAFALGPVVFQ